MQTFNGNSRIKFSDIRNLELLNEEQLAADLPLYTSVQKLLGSWVSHSFQIPEEGWDLHSMTMRFTGRGKGEQKCVWFVKEY